ncbi:MAG: bifunctional oligoribonuclease/PAP phosphatase NrnA [Candidatus Spechtbacterales bacterium]
MTDLVLSPKLEEAKKLIKESERILLAGHVSPDGDSLGSLLALSQAIRDNLGKETLPYMTDDRVPSSLDFLPGSDELTEDVPWFPDLIIGVDYGDFERLALPNEMIESAKLITFDHHPESGQKGDVNIIDTSFSSTAELVYIFLKSSGWQISSSVATCLLVGILTDTGGFSHNTSARTFNVAGELLQKGAPLSKIYTKALTKGPHVLKAWGDVLSSAEIDEGLNLIVGKVSVEKFLHYGIVLDDLEELKNRLNALRKNSIALLLMEPEKGLIKGSFRSTEPNGADVSFLAEKLGGGGHKHAAAFNIEGASMEEVEEKAKSALQEAIEEKSIKLDIR